MSSLFGTNNDSDMKNAYATARARFEPNIGMKPMPAYSATAHTNRFEPKTRFEPTAYTNRFEPKTRFEPTAYTNRFEPKTRFEPTAYTNSFVPETRFEPTAYTNSFEPKTRFEPTAYTNSFVPETPVEPKIDMIKLPAYSETGNAEHDIASIAVHAFADIYNYRCGTPRMWKNFRDKVTVEKQIIASAEANINRIMIALSPHPWIDREDSSKKIDYAIWRLLTMVSTLEDKTGEIDLTAAYVMMDLLYPQKSDTLLYDGNSLLYKTVREIDFKFGVGLFGTILSRNDQRFRTIELEDTKVIQLFEMRYKTKLADRFKATYGSYDYY
jgi:hypothetical protein